AAGSLGHCDDRHIANAELGEDRLPLGQPPLPAVYQHPVGPHAALALGILFQRAIEAAAEHLAHHRVIIPARRCRLLKAPTRPPPRVGLPPPLAGEGWGGRVIIPARPAGRFRRTAAVPAAWCERVAR